MAKDRASGSEGAPLVVSFGEMLIDFVPDVAGLSLTKLFVGSEGTLGVITELTLRLLPQPPAGATLVATFDSIEASAAAVVAITAALRRDERAIGETIAKLAPAGKSLANATGNGSWGDVSGPAGPLPDNLLCVAGLVEGCR